MTRRQYLGDAVYIDYDGTDLILTTEDGVEESNRIILEPAVIDALERYLKNLHDELERGR